MPKIAVLFFDAKNDASTLAQQVARGAQNVRFSEVDVLPGTRATRDSLHQYDGIILVASAASDVEPLLHEMATGADFTNAVFGFVGDGALAGRLAQLGGIVATVRTQNNRDEAATMVGARVAKVAGWVHHALGHEHGHHHPH